MRIGVARRNITPSIGTEMGGYGIERKSKGVHDALYTKVVIIDTHIFIGLDLVAIDHNLRERIESRVDLHGYTMSLSASHTHSGPAGTLDTSGMLKGMSHVFGDLNDELLVFIAEQSVAAINEAFDTMEPFILETSKGTITGAYSNRHSETKLYNNTLITYLFKTETKSILMYSFACHPTIMHADNLLFSKDLIDGIENAADVDFMFFLNGPNGDISTRFVRNASTFAEVERIGLSIWEQISQTIARGEETILSPIVVHNRTYELHTKQTSMFDKAIYEQYTKAFELTPTPELRTKIEGMEIERLFADTIMPPMLPVEVQIISAGKHTLVMFPGELFGSLCPANAWMITNSNGYHAYFADKDAYDHNYYEALTSFVSPGATELMIQQLQKDIEEITDGN
ncbi:hypothetical protein G7062_05340 [Erysipelothrix sp. HDW6C]|uniref:neutral/alkaline non-lysosomal ceramidase N-terminal domain-containing protein n=1 Tax=Erysipelothrix sp. HDW6C TaxID=2714930 RepID=UPI00140A54D7|nr:neutral/alkaline non-lysosomal ceramidase N-terminal domain-containing protein [Erysipelothrix sp. HDW6C]QIK69756.1 hypothetical protein G7062_05340 [Erysipelothrix sp. HDW6C]